MPELSAVEDRTILDELNKIQPTTKEGKTLIPALVKAFEKFEFKLEAMLSDLKEEFLSVAKSQGMIITALKDKVGILEKKVSALEDKVDDQEAYERREQIILSGSCLPDYKNDESCVAIVCTAIKSELKIDISSSEISMAHRLGAKPRTQKPDRRNIIVKFCRREMKKEILAACRKVKPKNLYINESLTPTRQSCAFALRKAKKDFPEIISGTSSIDGKVYAWLKPPNGSKSGAKDIRVAINSPQKLKDFFVKSLNTPLCSYMPSLNI